MYNKYDLKYVFGADIPDSEIFEEMHLDKERMKELEDDLDETRRDCEDAQDEEEMAKQESLKYETIIDSVRTPIQKIFNYVKNIDYVLKEKGRRKKKKAIQSYVDRVKKLLDAIPDELYIQI